MSWQHEIHGVLDSALARVSLVPARSEIGAVYASVPIGDIIFLLSLSEDRRTRSVIGSYVIQPLPIPFELSIAEPFVRSRSVRWQSPGWPVARLAEFALELAKQAAEGMAGVRNRFDGVGLFANEVDGEYLADDWPELAEAVAYLRFLDDHHEHAAARLLSLSARTEGIEPETTQRAGRMAAMIAADPASAKLHLEGWRRAHLDRYGFESQP